MLRNIITKILIAISFVSCKEVKQYNNQMLLGTWKLEGNKDQINYPALTFKTDSSAVFQSRGDTIYSFTYLIKNRKLILIDYNGAVSIDSINELGSERFKLMTLRENKRSQRYIRIYSDK